MKRSITRIAAGVLVLVMSSYSFGQQTLTINPQSLDIVDMPNAATVEQGVYGIGLRVYPNGGVLSNFTMGILNRFSGRIYYGGENLIGAGDINWNPHVGIAFKVRIIDETLIIPGIAAGINTQGYGGYHEADDRYLIKSRGLFVVASRNYTTGIGDVSVHGGVNVSLERHDDDKDLNFFAGITKDIKSFSELMIEYDAAVNDNESTSLGKGNGYLNAGIRFFISEKFILAFHFKDLLENTNNTAGFAREIRLEFRDIVRY